MRKNATHEPLQPSMSYDPAPIPTVRQLLEFQRVLTDCSYELEVRGQRAAARRLSELLAWVDSLVPASIADESAEVVFALNRQIEPAPPDR